MGNRFNQELYGPPTNLPWAFHINPTYPCQEPAGSPMACGAPDRLTAAARQWYATHGFHPTFFYEALWNVVGLRHRVDPGPAPGNWLRDGDVFCMYLIWYPVGPLLGGDVPPRCLAHGLVGHRPVDLHHPVYRGRGGADHQSCATATAAGAG